jgi:hypothetical protein
VGVYWLDDTGEGRFRVPESWRLLYKDPSGWHEVKNASGYGTQTDKYNFVTFDPVKTRLLRLEVQLKSGFSGGVLEVKVK